MKRNWETIREILTKLEDVTFEEGSLQLANFPSERAEVEEQPHGYQHLFLPPVVTTDCQTQGNLCKSIPCNS